MDGSEIGGVSDGKGRGRHGDFSRLNTEGAEASQAGASEGKREVRADKMALSRVSEQGAWKIVEQTGRVRGSGITELEAAFHEAQRERASPPQESSEASFRDEVMQGGLRALEEPPPELLRERLRRREEAVEARREELSTGIEKIDGVIGDLERRKELKEAEKSVHSRPIEIAQARLEILQARFTIIRKNPERQENSAPTATSAQELKAIEDARVRVGELERKHEESTTELREIDVNLADANSKRDLLVNELNEFRVRGGRSKRQGPEQLSESKQPGDDEAVQ